MGELLLICTVGLPRSGKSTWAQSFEGRIPIVNPDAIRYALHGQRYQALAEDFVWAIAKVMVRALFAAGHSTVIVDATNTTRRRRDEWQNKGWVTKFKVIDTPEDVCQHRALEEGDADILPIIAKMAEQWEPLAADEIATTIST